MSPSARNLLMFLSAAEMGVVSAAVVSSLEVAVAVVVLLLGAFWAVRGRAWGGLLVVAVGAYLTGSALSTPGEAFVLLLSGGTASFAGVAGIAPLFRRDALAAAVLVGLSLALGGAVSLALAA